MSVLKAVEAGVDVVDACLSPLALRTSQPAVEPLVVEPVRDRSGQRPGSRQAAGARRPARDRPSSLQGAPGRSQERLSSTPRSLATRSQAGWRATCYLAAARRGRDRPPRRGPGGDTQDTRKELGYPPLVTPMSQMVGTQAVSNVLFGRYEMISEQVKHYVGGRYGRPPAALDPNIARQVLKGEEDGTARRRS